MRHKTAFLIVTTISGFLTLSFFSIIQRLILGFGFMTNPKAYVVPLIYGGTIGFWLGKRQLHIRKNEADLRASVQSLEAQSQELQMTEEMLRCQIEEYHETHERLLAGERSLQERNDELTATEEMLREQIYENEANQRELERSNRSLQALFDVSPLPMVVSKYPEDVILEINQKFTDDFGYAAADVIGKTSAQAGIWNPDTGAGSFMDLLGDRRETAGLSVELKTSDALLREVLLSCAVLDYKGEKCLLTVCLDVTEQKKMEDMLRQNQKMEVVGQLAGGVAHDFNNMLAAIIGSADLLVHHVEDNPKAMTFISTIMEAASRSADLTRQLLAFSRKGKRELVPLCMNDAIKAVMAMLERTIDKKITLKARLDAENSMVVGDPALLKNALLNLGINARDAMPDGGSITLATADVIIDREFVGTHGCPVTPGQYLQVSVSDTGFGMSRQVAERIFEPFFTTKGAGKGTGLGLAAVYRTVKDHRGCIDVQSEPGVGTAFTLYFPLSDQKRQVTAVDELPAAGSGDGVLLVDDEPLIRNSGKDMLEELGYRVLLAQDGEEALEVYAGNREDISLVILDMVMPKLGGEKALQLFRERFPEVKVLLSSGMEWTGAKGGSQYCGAQGFIHKPYRKLELCKAVRMALGDQEPCLEPAAFS